jgi:hypothetical protein
VGEEDDVGLGANMERPVDDVDHAADEGRHVDDGERHQQLRAQKQGLPDGTYIFRPKIQILEGLAMEDVDISYRHLVYFTAIGYILWTFGIFYGHLVYFMDIWYVIPRKIWQPNPTITSYSASVVQIYNAGIRLERFYDKIIFSRCIKL